MSRKGKTIVLTSNTAWSLANFRLGLIKHLISQNARVVVVSPVDDYSDTLIEAGAEFIPLPMDSGGINPVLDLWLIGRLWLCYRKINPDLVINYTIKPVIYGALVARILSLPVVSFVPGLGNIFARRTLLTSLVENLYRFTQRHVLALIVLNNRDDNYFIERGLAPVASILSFPGEGVDIDHFSPSGDFDKRQEPFVFLMMARMIKDKGVGVFVEAAKRIKNSHTGVEFWVAGFMDVNNPTAVHAEELSHWVQNGIVRFFTAVRDVRPILEQSNVAVLPSFYPEGLPRSLLEAAAMEKPIITTRTPGCIDTVEESVTGLLCNPRDVGDLEAKMNQVLEMDSSELRLMGQKGRERVIKEFSEDMILGLYDKLLNDILERPVVV